MGKYLIKRLAQALIVLVGVSLLTFVLVNVAPGDPVLVMLNKRADEGTIARVRAELGTDRPLYVQYLDFAWKALHGDFGISYFQKTPVIDIVAAGWKVTMRIGLMSLCVAAVMGVGIGTLCAVFRGRWIDRLFMFVSMLNISAPVFWVAVVMQILFGLTLKWLPISGQSQPGWMIMPVVCLGISYGASSSRLVRTSMIEALTQDYVRTAQAKGLSQGIVVFKHVLKNAAIPIITLLGMQLCSLICGAMVVETVFSLNGLGEVSFSAISQRDLPIIQGCVMYTAFVYVLINLVIDLLYAAVDPRIRITKGAK